ncbi:sulfur carrier protein ThiS [bacterium]|nr:sulfur carrier protein ThiS [bacterium]
MNVKVNGKIYEFTDAKNIIGILERFDIRQLSGIAVALNDSVVPKSEFEKILIKDGDVVEIIRATQGG